jgi:hypothetical protein
VSENVALCVVEPAVAVIVTVEVPAGVPALPPGEELEPPPQPANPKTAIARTAAVPRRLDRVIRFDAYAAKIAASANRATSAESPSTDGPDFHRRSRIGAINAVPADVAIVSVVVTAAPLGVTVAGLNEHVASWGKPEHVKLVFAVKPPDGVSVIVDVAELPAATVALPALSVRLKSPVLALPTVT